MKKLSKAFTLVELIIVITILAILATIAFVSFSSYTASSRDTKRIVTIESIAKGLNIFQTQTGKYPNVDNQSSTGIINSDTLSFVGEVGDNVSKLINISPTPKDPVSGNNFKYATSFDNKYFQVAGTQEKPVAEKSIINQSYANSRQAKVLGNYNGLLKKGNKLYNLPSLIYTGSGYLLSNSTYFIVDKGQNIPYKITATDPDNSVQTSVILSQLTGTSSVVLTGVTIPSTPGELKTNIDTLVKVLGYPGDKIGQESFGREYFINKNFLTTNSSVFVGTFKNLCTSFGEMYYIDNLGGVLASVSSAGEVNYVNGKTFNDFNCSGHILMCGNNEAESLVLQSCNIGSTTVGTGVASYGKLFQWGENIAWDVSSGVASSNNCTWDRENQTCSNPSINGWNSTVSDTGSGGLDRWFDYADTRGPCPIGYRLPTVQELGRIMTIGNWLDDLGLTASNVLQAPLLGYRSTSGVLSFVGARLAFQSSTPFTNRSYAFVIVLPDIMPTWSLLGRGTGLSVRCLKN